MANEARCTALGANCIASEPLNTNSYSYSNPYCNPGDTSGGDKQMSGESGAGGPAIINADGEDMGAHWTYPSSGALFTALPNISPSVNFLLQSVTNGKVNALGHKFTSSDATARRSMRWYVYFSPTWQASTGSCLNSGKIFELGNQSDSMVFTTDGTNHQVYGFGDWNIAPFDCCNGGPGAQAYPFNAATMNGKWWRFELVVRNALPTGSVTIVELWRRNVTDDGANIKVIDTADPSYGPGTGGADWTSTQATTLKPNSRLDVFLIFGWRNGTCTGFTAYSHLLAAAWSSDAGQMIGAASELEGGGGSTGYPIRGFRV